jgi:hypothetical protein
MIKRTLKDQLPLDVQEKLAKLRKASKPLTDTPPKTHQKNKKPIQVPGNLAKKIVNDLPLVDKENQRKAKEQFLAARAWLENTFPKAFNFKDPKPLKLNIEHDLFQVDAPFSRTLIRKVITSYVYKAAYLKSVAQGGERFDLQGEKAGEVRQADKDYALEHLKQRKILRQQKIAAGYKGNKK